MSDLTNKQGKELASLLEENREALRKFRFGISGSKTRNVKEGRNIRKDIARILTEQNRRMKQL
jgi:ribosomal protein L29